jgi:hypothetical protein
MLFIVFARLAERFIKHVFSNPFSIVLLFY